MSLTFVAGPMATISHPAFRCLLEHFGGCDEYFTEMINAGTLLTGGQFEKFYINPAPVPQKVVWQLTGRDTAHMRAAAAVLVRLGGIGLDLNMGCSAPDIYRYGAGIAWMTKPVSQTQEMVRAVREEIDSYKRETGEKKRLSVKLRLGDDDFSDDGFFSFCDMLADCGVELLSLHPRTKKEKLVRPPRYGYCQRLCERYKGHGIRIILNGNIRDGTTLDHALSAAPDVDGVMISRAAVQRPWIFRQLRGLPPLHTDLQQLALDYITGIEQYQPPEFWRTRLQRFFTYYCDNFKFAHYAKTSFLNAASNDDLRARITDFFQKCPDERYRET